MSLLEEQAGDRVRHLVPIRYGRMLAPFAYLRGSAIVMASDLAGTPASGLGVQACGDAHLMSFGMWATPARAIERVAVAYADQNEKDYGALVAAARSGRIEIEEGV